MTRGRWSLPEESGHDQRKVIVTIGKWISAEDNFKKPFGSNFG